LFKKDISQWGWTGSMIELVGRRHDLVKDKELAFPFMLTEQTKKLHEHKERINFFTN
jgi:hypothetical protein